MKGKVSFCGTPIGNLEDITLRVLETLKACDVVYAEDTRHSVKLLNHFDISKPLYSYHEHNKSKAGNEIAEKVMCGEHVALVTDAGMPGVSDPGEALVKLCIEQNLDFEIVPGVTAFSTALVGSGLPTDRFSFEGFLSRDKKTRRQHLESLKTDTRTLIFYESPFRLKKTLALFLDFFGDRKAVVARELTKRYETFQRGRLSELIEHYASEDVKGEIVLLLEGAEPVEAVLEGSPVALVKALMADGLSKKEAIKEVAVVFKCKKSEVYAQVLESEDIE